MSKKQPLRNQLLRIKKLEQELKQTIISKEREREHNRSLYVDYERQLQDARMLRQAAEDELRYYNPYHPLLDAQMALPPMRTTDLFQYRIFKHKMGVSTADPDHSFVSFLVGEVGSYPEEIGMGFSRAALDDYGDRIVDEMAKHIARELYNSLRKKF